MTRSDAMGSKAFLRIRMRWVESNCTFILVDRLLWKRVICQMVQGKRDFILSSGNECFDEQSNRQYRCQGGREGAHRSRSNHELMILSSQHNGGSLDCIPQWHLSIPIKFSRVPPRLIKCIIRCRFAATITPGSLLMNAVRSLSDMACHMNKSHAWPGQALRATSGNNGG